MVYLKYLNRTALGNLMQITEWFYLVINVSQMKSRHQTLNLMEFWLRCAVSKHDIAVIKTAYDGNLSV